MSWVISKLPKLKLFLKSFTSLAALLAAGPNAMKAAVAVATPPAANNPVGPMACSPSMTLLIGDVSPWSVEPKDCKPLVPFVRKPGRFANAADRALIPAMPTTVLPPKSNALATSARRLPNPPSLPSSLPNVFMKSLTLRVASFTPPVAALPPKSSVIPAAFLASCVIRRSTFSIPLRASVICTPRFIAARKSDTLDRWNYVPVV